MQAQTPARGAGGRFLPAQTGEPQPRAKPTEPPPAPSSSLAALVDELGDLERETLPWRAKISRLEALRAAVRGAYASEQAGSIARVEGERWICVVGAAGFQSVVNRAALHERVGPEKFMAVAQVSIKAIEEACGKDVAGSVVSMAQTGPRTLSLVPR